MGTASLRRPIDDRLSNNSNRVLPWNDAFVQDGTSRRLFSALISNNPCPFCAARTCPPSVRMFSREKPTAATDGEEDASTRASLWPFCAHRAVFFRIEIYEDRLFRTISKSRNNSRVLPLLPSASPPKSLSDRFFFLPLAPYEAPFCKEKKVLSQLPFHAPHGSLRFFPFAARSPISPSRFPRFSNLGDSDPPVHGWVPRPTSGKTDQGNEFFFFFHFFYTYTYVLARAFVRPPAALFLSFPSLVRACIGWRSSHHNAEKKISLKICLTVQPKLGPVLLIMGFLLAPRVSSNKPWIYVDVSIGHHLILATFSSIPYL